MNHPEVQQELLRVSSETRNTRCLANNFCGTFLDFKLHKGFGRGTKDQIHEGSPATPTDILNPKAFKVAA